MSMINCPECNKEISNQAKVCPNCGMPIYKMKHSINDSNYEKKTKPNILSITAIGIAVIALFLSFGIGTYATELDDDDDFYEDDYYDDCSYYGDDEYNCNYRECDRNDCGYDDCECGFIDRKNAKKSKKPEKNDSEEIDEDKDLLDSDEFEDKVVLVNFWATWCGYCVDEMPDLQKIYDEYKDNENVEIIAVNVGESEKKADSFMEDNKYTIPVEYDTDSELFGELGVDSLPYTIVINKAGEVEKIFEGATDYDAMKKAIDKSL